jgi:hypothetical protein
MRDRPNVAVTFFLHGDKRHSIWDNGAAQNCVFLVRLLRASGSVGKVFAVNGGHDAEPHPALMLGGLEIEFVRMADVIDQVDVLIEAGAQVSAESIASVRSRGGRVVAYKFGNAYVIDMERVLFSRDAGAIFNGAVYDQVWTTAQHMRTNAAWWQTMYRAPVLHLPHIWEPLFVDKAITELPDGAWGYKPGAKAKRISVFEPNINVVKASFIPACVIEQAYRLRPDLIDHVYLTNTFHLKEHLTFNSWASALDLWKARKCSFEGRFNTPYFLSTHTDVVVSHQWECGLNYAYYDALHGHYPLVHNSELLPDGIGYRYDGFDAVAGGRLLASVLQVHDSQHEAYSKRCDDFLATVLATSPQNIQAHESAIKGLWQ